MFDDFFGAIGDFFENVFKDIVKLVVVLLQCIMIALAIVFTFGTALIPTLCVCLAIGVIALGTENKFLLKAIAVLSLVAAVALMWVAPTQWLAMLGELGLGGTVIADAVMWWIAPGQFWYRIAFFGYSAFTTVASIVSATTGETMASAMMSVASETISGTISTVTDILGAITSGVASGLGLGSMSNILLIGAACFVGYKVLTKPASEQVKIAVATPAAPSAGSDQQGGQVGIADQSAAAKD